MFTLVALWLRPIPQPNAVECPMLINQERGNAIKLKPTKKHSNRITSTMHSYE